LNASSGQAHTTLLLGNLSCAANASLGSIIVTSKSEFSAIIDND